MLHSRTTGRSTVRVASDQLRARQRQGPTKGASPNRVLFATRGDHCQMLYASTRNALTKSLGSVFTDSLFATCKADVVPGAYAAHKRHQAAPKPLSAREREMADVKAAEREAGAGYEGSRARQNHVGSREIGYAWAEEAREAVGALRVGEGSHLVILVSFCVDDGM